MATGCGDSADGDDKSPAAPKLSAAKERPETFAKRLAKLLETTTAKKQCDQLDSMMRLSQVIFPCPPDRKLSRSMADFKVQGAEEHGTGAVVDYTSGANKDGASILLFAAANRTWGVSLFGVATKPSVGTSDAKSRAGNDEAIASYLRAIRTRDCAAFKKVAYTTPDVRDKICSTAFAGTRFLTTLLRKNPAAEPAYLGGNSVYGFYSLETPKPKPTNRTITVADGKAIGAPRSIVMGAWPSPTSADQRKVLQQLRRQQQNDAKPKTSPSQKTDG